MAASRSLSAGFAPSPDRAQPRAQSQAQFWGLEALAGRLVEISGHRAAANLTVAFGLVLEAQRKGEPVAWVTLDGSTFFPPDAAESGIDLTRLVVVRVQDARGAARATVELTRSGGFDLVVLDLGPEALQKETHEPPAKKTTPRPPRRYRRVASAVSVPLITKLVGLAQKTKTAVVILTDKTSEASSLSSLVSLRAETKRNPDALSEIEIAILKDKRRGPGRRYREVFREPAGLC